MSQNTYVITGMPSSLEEQKVIGQRINQVKGVRFTGGSTEGLITVEMDRCHIADVRRALGPGFERVDIITYRKYVNMYFPHRRRDVFGV